MQLNNIFIAINKGKNQLENIIHRVYSFIHHLNRRTHVLQN